jgi:hypothetical protein
MNEQQELAKDMLREIMRLEAVFHEANAHMPKADRDLAIISAMAFETINYAMTIMKMPADQLVQKIATSMAIHEIVNK